MDRWTAVAAGIEQTWPRSCMSTIAGSQELGLLASWCQRDVAFPWPFN